MRLHFSVEKALEPKGFQIAPEEADSCILYCAFPNNNSVKEKVFLLRVTYCLIPYNVLHSQSTLSTLCLRPVRSLREKKSTGLVMTHMREFSLILQ